MGLAAGVDVGGTKIAAGVVDERGVVVERTRVPTPKTDPDRLRDVIVEIVDDLRSRHDLVAVGIGAAGFVTADARGVVFAPHVDFGTPPLADPLVERIGLPVVVENDGNAAAWAEFRFGAGRNVPDQLMVALGTGIGGGLILGGELYRGGNGFASEIGHINLVPHGRPCNCGRQGCWEQYASGNALQRYGREAAGEGRAPALLAAAGGDPAAVTGALVTKLATAGDADALALFEQLADSLGPGLGSLVAILDPTLVVIGGGVSEAGDLLLGPVDAALDRELTGRGRRPVPELCLAALGNTAGMIGAADLARRHAP